MAITEQRMRLDEFLNLPEEKPALELIDGVVRQKVSPDFLHGMVQTITAMMVNDFAMPRQLAVAVSEVRTTAPENSRVPDIGVYRWDRVPVDDEGNYARFPHDHRPLPDIAIEIKSPSETIRQQAEKCRWYVAMGSAIALMIDADRRTIWDCRPAAEPRQCRGSDVVNLDEVIPGFSFTVEELFGRLRRPGPR